MFRTSFFKGTVAGFAQSKQTVYPVNTVIDCWPWLACTDRATLSTIVYSEWSLPVPLKYDAHASSPICRNVGVLTKYGI